VRVNGALHYGRQLSIDAAAPSAIQPIFRLPRMSLRRVALGFVLRRWLKPRLGRTRDVAAARARSGRTRLRVKPAPGWRIRPETSAALKGEWIEPTAADHAAWGRCILYLHGGGYILMSPQTHRPITTRLAAWSEARLFALDYRLAPEHPFPAALDDAVAAYRALIEAGTPPDHIAVAGDSAGGGLALALLVALRDAGDTLPACAVAFSPWTDLAAAGQSVIDNEHTEVMLSSRLIAPTARLYLGDTPATDPLASPVYADLTGLPPLLVQVSDSEILLDDSRRVAENARRSGVHAILRVWHGLPHVWQYFARFLPEARVALREAATFIRARLT
jgi:epsilon-lactone hydrolase